MAEQFIKMQIGESPGPKNDFSSFNGKRFTYGPNVKVGRTVQVRVATSQSQSRNWEEIRPEMNLQIQMYRIQF